MGKWKKSSQELIDHFYETMESFDDIEMRKMFGYPCTFLNGNMLTGLHEENWILRLSEEDRLELSEKGGLPFEPMDRKMREYLLIPQNILKNRNQLNAWVQRAIDFVSSLPPK
ncbi:MAG: TfoX/Sxy family protein [Simkaniaceae bacterium]|nr:MAG: TfoX/Sxy family protein [Simkaniaceae bacterium]